MAKKRANGEGNIRKRADGRWEGRYTAGYHPETGKRIIKNVLGKTQAECKAKLSAAMEASRGIDVSRADEYTVATWLRSWYELYAKPNIRISTANRYQLMVEQYTIPHIGSIKLTKLTAHDLQKLYKDLMENGRIDRKSGHGNPGLSSTTVRSLHLMLHNAFERAVKERLIPRNPTEDCIAPKIQKFEMQILQPEHIKCFVLLFNGICQRHKSAQHSKSTCNCLATRAAVTSAFSFSVLFIACCAATARERMRADEMYGYADR